MKATLAKIVADFRRLPLRVFFAKATARCERAFRTRALRLRSQLVGLGLSEAALERHLRRQGISRAAWSKVFSDQLKHVSLLNLANGRPADGLEEAFKKKLKAGNDALTHVFDLLGSGPTRVNWSIAARGRGAYRYRMTRSAAADAALLTRLRARLARESLYEPIDWHADFISGYRWSSEEWHADIAAGSVPGADIRVPWELSRCYHLVTLAQCWALSRDSAYTEEIVAQITDFVVANPIGFGPNWVSPMDVAIRVSNWVIALSAVAHAGGLDDERAIFLARAIHDHARFVEENLEWSAEVNGNHYTANLVGLYFVAVCCPQLPRAGRWREFAQRELEREIQQQVYEDGCDFEGSTLYHRLVLELFLYAALIARKSGREFSTGYLSKVSAMCRALRGLVFNNGEIAQIGDNDSARFIALDALPLASLRVDHYLPVADWFFGEPAAAYPRDVDMSHLWWLGGDVSAADTAPWGNRPSALFRDAGWAILRRGDWECLISCGPNGQRGNGGHGHNDKLGVSLAFAGAPLFVDPGSYLYTADRSARNEYRSTAFHSTPQLAAREQNPLPQQLFSLPDTSKARIVSFSEDSFLGVHEAFGHPVYLELQLTDDSVLFDYRVGPGCYTMRWLLHPDVAAEVSDSAVLLSIGCTVFRLLLSDGKVALTEYRFSPAYGRVVPATMVVTRFASPLSGRVDVVQRPAH